MKNKLLEQQQLIIPHSQRVSHSHHKTVTKTQNNFYILYEIVMTAINHCIYSWLARWNTL